MYVSSGKMIKCYGKAKNDNLSRIRTPNLLITARHDRELTASIQNIVSSLYWNSGRMTCDQLLRYVLPPLLPPFTTITRVVTSLLQGALDPRATRFWWVRQNWFLYSSVILSNIQVSIHKVEKYQMTFDGTHRKLFFTDTI